MTYLQKWADISSWTDGAFGTSAANLNSLGANRGALGSGVISNTNLDLYMDCSFQTTSSITPLGNAFLSLYLLPLLGDGVTYPDAASGTSSTYPALNFLVASVNIRTTAGNVNALFRGIVLPPGSCKLYFMNQANVALPSSGMKFLYRTYSEINNG